MAGRRLIIEINKDIEKYQESVAMGLSAKQLAYSILALGSGCGIVFILTMAWALWRCSSVI